MFLWTIYKWQIVISTKSQGGPIYKSRGLVPYNFYKSRVLIPYRVADFYKSRRLIPWQNRAFKHVLFQWNNYYLINWAHCKERRAVEIEYRLVISPGRGRREGQGWQEDLIKYSWAIGVGACCEFLISLFSMIIMILLLSLTWQMLFMIFKFENVTHVFPCTRILIKLPHVKVKISVIMH